MKTFYDVLKASGDLHPEIIKVAKMDLIEVTPNYETGRCSIGRKEAEFTEKQVSFMRRFFDEVPYRNKLDTFIRFKVLLEGPKIFRPTAIQCRLLEQMTLNLKIEEYVQPYGTIIIEYPEDFADTKIMDMDIEDVPHGALYKPGVNRPLFSMLHHDPEKRMVFHSLVCETMASHLAIYSAAYNTIEEWLTGAAQSDHNEVAMRRISMAYSMVLDEYGVKLKRPADPEDYEKLKTKSKAKSAGKFDAARLLSVQPMVYEINQTPVLAVIVKDEASLPGEPTGRKMPPHRRRGHYANVACGVGRTERRRVRRPPVFVNKHLFLGEMANTMVTYSE